MILAVDAGEGKFWKLWSTLPRAISDSLRDADGQFLPLSALKGETVRFTAKIEKSDRDECFAFAKRPTKAERVERCRYCGEPHPETFGLCDHGFTCGDCQPCEDCVEAGSSS